VPIQRQSGGGGGVGQARKSNRKDAESAAELAKRIANLELVHEGLDLGFGIPTTITCGREKFSACWKKEKGEQVISPSNQGGEKKKRLIGGGGKVITKKIHRSKKDTVINQKRTSE